MNQMLPPRSFIIPLSILMAVTIFVGTLRPFVPAQAASILDDRALKTDLSTTYGELLPTSTSAAGLPPLGPTPTPPSDSLLPPAATATPMLPTPTLVPEVSPTSRTVYADTTGIIALGILMVVVVLIGIILGERSLLKKKEPTKK